MTPAHCLPSSVYVSSQSSSDVLVNEQAHLNEERLRQSLLKNFGATIRTFRIESGVSIEQPEPYAVRHLRGQCMYGAHRWQIINRSYGLIPHLHYCYKTSSLRISCVTIVNSQRQPNCLPMIVQHPPHLHKYVYKLRITRSFMHMGILSLGVE